MHSTKTLPLFPSKRTLVRAPLVVAYGLGDTKGLGRTFAWSSL